MPPGGNRKRTWTVVNVLMGAGVIGLCMAACASDGRESTIGDPKPGWVDRPREGADGRILVGVGVGGSRDIAIDGAMARLAQSIEVRVIAEEEARSAGEMNIADGQRSASARSFLDRSVRLRVDQRLAGVRIERTWRDPATGEWHARVSLDRREAARGFDRRVEEAARRAEAAMRRADEAAGWRRVVNWREAMLATDEAIDHARARDALLGDASWAVALSELLKDRERARLGWERARRSVRVAVQWTTAESAAFGRAIADRISDFGILTLAGDADVLIVCEIALSTGPAFDGRTRATRWALTVRAVSADDRRTLAARRETGSSVSRADSERAAVDAAMIRLEAILPGFLKELFGADELM